jgi:hypothetical protein
MLKRKGGATVEEMMAQMVWQKHTTRALLERGRLVDKETRLSRDQREDWRTAEILH